MKLMPSIKTKSASVMAITALAVASTSVLPAQAQHNNSDTTGTNASDNTGLIARIIRFSVRRAIRQQVRQGVEQGVGQYTDLYDNAQRLFGEIEACAASNCSELGELLTEAAGVVEGFPEPPVLPQ
ncbi:hypothetical protein [Moorena bouillonii]|uniref:Uncharacterized protein n=1 Tax=Moorena bouillonii PNG TaxID=568701 RepID=A0A1U7N9J1_9CYAN|nr:hypothetical protein [Moorena bouillonii]OLT62584.1 hypothetical protein BJP37_29710 [Moorena bouillonii PNG]